MSKKADYQGQLHHTAEQLVDTALEIMETKPVDKVTVEEVLNRSGVARSSLYHHFEDFHHLMEVALIRKFTTDSYARVLDIGRERGWINPRVSPEFLSTLLQAYTVGRVIDDVTEHPLSNEEWIGGIAVLQDMFFLNSELTKGLDPTH